MAKKFPEPVKEMNLQQQETDPKEDKWNEISTK
jgi:hypothetical protein